VQLLVLAVGFGVWTWADFAEAEREASEEVENSTLVLEEHVLRSLSAIDGALLQTADLVQEIGLRGLHGEATWRRLNSIAKSLPRSGAIFIYDLNGDTIAASTSHPAPVFNAFDRDYFQHIVALKADHYIGKALKGRTVHQFFFPIARSIKAADGQVQAVAQVGVAVDYIADLFTKAELRGKAFGLYLLSDGALVARHPMTERLLDERIATLPFFSALSAGTSHWTGWVNEKRGRQLATARRVSELPLLLTASVPYKEVFGHAYNQLVWRGVGLLAAVGILVTLGVMLFKSASREEQSQNALRDANERYELVLEGAQSGIWDWDIPRRKVSFSPVWKTMRGYSEEEISDNEEEWSRRIHPEDAPRVTAAVQAHFEGKTPIFNEEYRVQRKDGSWMWIADRGIAKRDATGSVVRMAGSETDITEHKQAEEALRESEAKYRNLFENMTEEVHFWQVVRDETGRIKTWRLVDVNPPALETWGKGSVDEIRGKTTDEIFGPDATDHYMPVVQKIMTEGVPYSFEDYFPNLDKHFRFTSVPVGDYFITTGADITDIRKAHEALRESEQRFRLALKNSSVLVAMQDSNLVYQWAYNTRTLRSEYVVGKTDADLFAPEDLPSILEAKSKVLQTGDVARLEHWLTSNGHRLFLDCYYEPVRDSAGKVIGVGIAAVNLTAQKQAEEGLRQLNLSLEQRVVGRTVELTRTVEVLQEEISQRERAEEELQLANEQLAQRADQLRRLAGELTAVEQTERKRLSRILHDGLQQHLASAKMQIGSLAEQIDNEDLKQTAEEIEKIIGEGVGMSRSLSAELSPPILHEGGLSEGLEWLIRWMREKHRFRVDLSLGAVAELREDVKMLVFESVRELLFNAIKHAQASRAQVRLELGGEGEMRVTVSDEGAGFDPCRILLAGDGGGFGLFSIRERIGLIGGKLEIDSAPGRGSRVALIVPHYQADTAPFTEIGACAPVVPPPKSAATDQETTIRVLLVDDHELFRNGIARLLKMEPGLEVVAEAKDGQEAIEFAQKHHPNVILMDISMPGINGIEATRVIHERHPEVCIIGLSMYDDPEKERAMRAAGAADYKTKMCAAAELIAAIREGLRIRKPSPP
jgi:PAS domain S-box-containing protein